MFESRRRPAHLSLLLRGCIALAIVAVLLWRTGLDVIFDTVRGADVSLLALAFLVMLGHSGVKAWTWHRLLKALGINEPDQFRGIIACYVTGSLFGTVVPSSAGTDAIRALLAHQRFGGDVSPYLASVIVLNVLNWIAACTLGLIVILLLALQGGIPLIGLVAAPIFCVVIAGTVSVYVLLKWRRDWWLRLLRRTPASLWRIRRPVRRFVDQLLVFQRASVRFAPFFAMALVATFGFACTLLLIGRSVGIHLEFMIWPIYGPLVAISALVPASISGFGAEQAAYVYFMSLVDVPQSKAFVASALLSILNLLFNVGLGALVFVFSPPRRATQSAHRAEKTVDDIRQG